MSLKQRVRLELEDGTLVETTYDMRDLRAWETKFGKSALVGPTTLTQLTFCGWSAAKRDGSINGQFDRWEAFDKVCVDVTTVARSDDAIEESPDPPGPTPESPSGG